MPTVSLAPQDQAALDAERLLNTMWGFGLPVDPVRIARALGITVVDTALDPSVAGAIVKEANKEPVILLNASDHPNRKRFTLAHELGHFIRRGDTHTDYEFVDRRDTLSTLGQDPEEIYANSFAANLLMPKEEVKRLHKEGASDLEMALRFGVSREAMGIRLAVLGIKPK